MKHNLKSVSLAIVLPGLSLGTAHAQSTITGDVNIQVTIEQGAVCLTLRLLNANEGSNV